MGMRANVLMKHNIDVLLRARGQTRHDLARWCRRTDAWISKIMSEETREFPMKYFDRIADFFGIATYQLLQPGISALTERRKATRRLLPDRRAGRLAEALRVLPSHAEIEGKLRALTEANLRDVSRWIDVTLLEQNDARAAKVTADLQKMPAAPAKRSRRTRGTRHG